MDKLNEFKILEMLYSQLKEMNETLYDIRKILKESQLKATENNSGVMKKLKEIDDNLSDAINDL
jgi:hypothetical protein